MNRTAVLPLSTASRAASAHRSASSAASRVSHRCLSCCNGRSLCFFCFFSFCCLFFHLFLSPGLFSCPLPSETCSFFCLFSGYLSFALFLSFFSFLSRRLLLRVLLILYMRHFSHHSLLGLSSLHPVSASPCHITRWRLWFLLL